MSDKKQYPSLSVQDEVTDFLLYTAPNSEIKVEVLLNNETIWLTQKQLAELFGVTVPTISEHLKNILKTSELDENSVIRKFRTTAKDGKNYLQENEIKSLEAEMKDYLEELSYE